MSFRHQCSFKNDFMAFSILEKRQIDGSLMENNYCIFAFQLPNYRLCIQQK